MPATLVSIAEEARARPERTPSGPIFRRDKLQLAPANAADAGGTLRDFYPAMFARLGPQRWWPSSPSGGPFEIIAGAILTQSTAWANVERAIANLRRARMLTPRAIERVPLARLARLVRPSGYFRQKARKLKAFAEFLRREYGGSLARMFRTPTAGLREKLLGVHGIGPETADSILLYAGGHPIFVVDAYTRRILERHGLIDQKAGYEEIRALFERNLPHDAQLWSEYHALLVNVGKNWCRPGEPRCEDCPLGRFLTSPLEAAGRNSKSEKRRTKIGLRWSPRRQEEARR
jgi:endonuclease-3 related protein